MLQLLPSNHSQDYLTTNHSCLATNHVAVTIICYHNLAQKIVGKQKDEGSGRCHRHGTRHKEGPGGDVTSKKKSLERMPKSGKKSLEGMP